MLNCLKMMANSLLIEGYASLSKGKEEWKDIPGYEGIYQASTIGRIRTKPGKTTSNARYSVRHWKTRILKQKLCGTIRCDYRVALWKDGKRNDFLVARLVALTWVPGFSEGMTVNHINGNPLDNRMENLEWVSRGENISKGFETGLYTKVMKSVILTDGSGGALTFNSMNEASKFLNRQNGYVSNCLKKNRCATTASGEQYRIEMVNIDG